MTPTAISTSGTVALILAALFCATVAHAAEMPKDLIGSWCLDSVEGFTRSTSDGAQYIRCKKGDEDLIIRRKSFPAVLP